MLDPHRLGVFQSVMVTGSVQEAADNLRMTPSAVSQHIAALQRQTGLDLFDRVGRGIVPTAAAEALIAQAETVLQQWHRLDDYVADLRDGRTGRLVLGYFPSAGSTLLPSIVRQITAEFPDLVVELVLTEVGARSTIPDIDVAMDHTENTRRPGYRKVPLTEDPYILAVHHEHPLARRRAVTLTDLKGEGWVSNDSFANPGHRIVLAACAAKGFTPRFTVQAQDHHSALGFVAAGVGITVLPRLAARIIPDGVVRVRITDPPVRQLVAMVREGGVRNAVADRVLDLLVRLSRHPSRRQRVQRS
ncbi:MAG TPA: LysR family transcriptional regulator [Phycicoccus elongatus]|jgi:DNA-binding transcriptional LysR family regulator|uniref:LysR family transcriptional regulator n=1 Tax=Phycicoccus TaxID=367298 RepID=UPI002583AC8A|nr:MULTISPECIES: LysR family transcriptional regulator [Phycicoccus]MBK8729056.1 LysR family transcriptional regulator [Tetrasphaera sp.]MCB9407155.1 LysR family transcriptional regulator [Tetrasphaera sp.]MCO5303004.1 LysR family transcriptional regulator [Phycicoccus sp.]HPK11804.1 LysR family transcriptional regulator [Phycicoccus elongatus]HPQ72352.1 LysR family transcriptional regulator [Phycicoccus elongatus]